MNFNVHLCDTQIRATSCYECLCAARSCACVCVVACFRCLLFYACTVVPCIQMHTIMMLYESAVLCIVCSCMWITTHYYISCPDAIWTWTPIQSDVLLVSLPKRPYLWVLFGTTVNFISSETSGGESVTHVVSLQ